MSRRSLTSSNNRTGITLIEVVAAIALLASLLVSILATHNRLARQTREAQERLVAVEAADRLLAEWTSTDPMKIPAAEGEIRGKTSLRWTLTGRTDPSLEDLGIQVAELSLYPEAQAANGRPLVSVEFLTTTAIAGQSP